MKLRNPMVLRALTKPGPSQIISVKALAAELRVTPGFLYHILLGRRRATKDMADRLTQVVATELSQQLFESEGEQNER